MRANIRRASSGILRAECGKCGRFLAEIHASTSIVSKCPSCKTDNTVRVWYSNPSGCAVRSKRDMRDSEGR